MTVTTDPADERISRLSAASLRKIIEPEIDVAGEVGPGQVVARELLSVADLNLDLTDDQWVRLSREEVASILDAGVRFESLLMAGFSLMLPWRPDLVDPRVSYILHEIGEETRHSRLFLRIVDQLAPQAVNPFTRGIAARLDHMVTSRAIMRPALFCVMVLTGEEAPDLIQRRTSEHPDTDPYIREVNKYHRMEEARHLSFARTILPELWKDASPLERFVVRRLGPLVMESIFDSLVHPGVYRAVGLPGWRTWNQARKTESRRQLRAEAFAPVCRALRDAGAFGRDGRIPRGWQRTCRVDAEGRPVS